ncbi:MAG: WYL domain-containing protein [Gilliamella sp.]|nr:WYL domain-containing protein [Gilliamella sp.]MCO6554695.1 WYL domain-containing protein [Gilliamella sp.]
MYEKSWDLFDLAFELQNSAEGLSLDEIQRRYNISLRTAQRMCAGLRDYFPNMEEYSTDGRCKRWRISSQQMNALFTFSPQELSALQASVNFLQQHNLHEQAKSLVSLETKIKNLLQSKKRKRSLEDETEALLKIEGLAFRPGPRFHLDVEILNTLRTALLNKKQIKIKYYNKNSGKYSHNTLEPYGILYSERNHYLLARHSDNYYGQQIHHFILHNIEKINILELSYTIPNSFNLTDYCQDMFGTFKEEPFDVEWRFSPEVAKEVRHYIFHPTQTMIENKDKSITVKFKAGGALEMSWYLYMWGNMVEVIKPVDFWNWFDEE